MYATVPDPDDPEGADVKVETSRMLFICREGQTLESFIEELNTPFTTVIPRVLVNEERRSRIRSAKILTVYG